MTTDNHRYATGVTRQQQRERNQRWQDRQRQQREWIASVAEAAGISKQSLLTPKNAALVAEILRRSGQEPSDLPNP